MGWPKVENFELDDDFSWHCFLSNDLTKYQCGKSHAKKSHKDYISDCMHSNPERMYTIHNHKDTTHMSLSLSPFPINYESIILTI